VTSWVLNKSITRGSVWGKEGRMSTPHSQSFQIKTVQKWNKPTSLSLLVGLEQKGNVREKAMKPSLRPKIWDPFGRIGIIRTQMETASSITLDEDLHDGMDYRPFTSTNLVY